jgi:hypothetical protein
MSAEKIMGETTVVQVVTPEMASEWLARNTRNRSINTAHVARLAEEIRCGRWRSTHQGIAFGADGTLYDGQHRLHAIVKAKTPVMMRVTFGLPVEALDAIDTGEGRNATDVLSIADGKHMGTNKRSSLVAAFALTTTGGIGIRGRTTVAHLRAALADHGDHYDAIKELVAAHDRLAQGPMIGALCICHKIAPEQTLEFARLIRDPSGLDKDHPAVALRDFVLLYYVAGNTNARMDLADRTFTAVRAFQKGQTRKFVRGGPAIRVETLNQWRRIMGREIPEVSDKA